MKSVTLILILLMSSQSFAGPTRPEPPQREQGRRGLEVSGKLKEALETLNSTARSVLGARFLGENFEVSLPKNLNREQMDLYERTFADYSKTLREKEAEFTRDSTKANEMAGLLLSLNKLYSGRDSAQSFLENANLSGANREAVETYLKTVDNIIVIMEVKMLETAESPVSYGQILRMMNIMGSLKVTGLRAQDFIDIEAQVTGMLPKNYTMKKAAECVK